MRAFRALVFAVGAAALCTAALAQDQGVPRAPAPSATTGAAPSDMATPATQTPIGHRQPTTANAPSSGANGAPVSPYDQQIDRNLDICKGC